MLPANTLVALTLAQGQLTQDKNIRSYEPNPFLYHLSHLEYFVTAMESWHALQLALGFQHTTLFDR